MVLQRYLSGIEVQLRNGGPCFTVEYQGNIDNEVLRRACDLLCDRYPVFRGRIRRDSEGFLLYVPDTHRPEPIVRDGDKETLREEAFRPWDGTQSLVRVLHIRGESRGFIALGADHAIADARNSVAMLDELWRLYTAIVGGSNIASERFESLPCAPNELLRERWGRIQPQSSVDMADSASVPIVDESITWRIHLAQQDTARLVEAAHKTETTVHALVCGSILVSLRSQEISTEPMPMMCLSIVDLRNRVTPSVGATETTNFIGYHRAEATVPLDGNPTILGRDIRAQLDAAIASREIEMNMPQSAHSQVATSLKQHRSNILVNNIGVVRRFCQPAGVRITDFFVPTRERTVALFPIHGVYTYDGQLSLWGVYPSKFFSSERVRQIVKRITTHLRQISE